jgi:NAD(P)-dependent dehydrogenase (short-subunit alcohol dehydrogenase family)
MTQKICMITGANTGIGKAAAIQIAQRGYHVILACRNHQKGEAALEEVREKADSDAVELMIVDMSRQASIREIADVFLSDHDRLDVLIHNAAIFDITQKEASYTDEEVESIWATNHLGPVLLTECLWSALSNSEQGRVITIASKGLIAKPFLKVDLDDPEFRDRSFSVENAYYQSKLAQIMFTEWLAGQQQGTAMTANCIRVPAVKVDVEKYAGLSPMLKRVYSFKAKFALSAEEMATAYTALATSEEFSTTTGLYFDEKLKPVKPPKYARRAKNIDAVMNLTKQYLAIEDFAVENISSTENERE